MFCLCFHTMAIATTMASVGPIRREHTPDGGICGFTLSHQYAPLGDVPHAVSSRSRRHGCRNRRRFRNILLLRSCRIKINYNVILTIYFNPFIRTLACPLWLWGRGYPRPIGRIHRYHAIGGAN